VPIRTTWIVDKIRRALDGEELATLNTKFQVVHHRKVIVDVGSVLMRRQVFTNPDHLAENRQPTK